MLYGSSFHGHVTITVPLLSIFSLVKHNMSMFLLFNTERVIKSLSTAVHIAVGHSDTDMECFLKNFLHNAYCTRALQINSLLNRMHLLHSTVALYETHNTTGQVSCCSLCMQKRLCYTPLSDVTEFGFPYGQNVLNLLKPTGYTMHQQV